MSRPYVSVQLAAQILADAGHRCGYCRVAAPASAWDDTRGKAAENVLPC